MWQFIISGYFPGTNYRLSFETIAGMLGLVVCLFLFKLLISEARNSTEQHDHSSIEAKTI